MNSIIYLIKCNKKYSCDNIVYSLEQVHSTLNNNHHIKNIIMIDCNKVCDINFIVNNCKNIINDPKKVTIYYSNNYNKSYNLGNLIAKLLLLFMTNVKCNNLLTGIIVVPSNYESLLSSNIISTLLNIINKKVNIVECEIIFKPQKISLFKLIKEVIIVFKQPIVYTLSSIVSASTDFISFYFLMKIPFYSKYWLITFSTVIARTIGSTVNFIINKNICFKAKGHTHKQVFLFTTLFLFKMFASSNLVSILSIIKLPILFWKYIVDGCLFFIGYNIQKKYIFKEE